MAFWFNRYKNYTSRGDVYLFTLRDYCEIMMIKQFGGTYLIRKDMPMKDGYLMEFPADQVDRVIAFVKGEDANAIDNGSLVTAKKNFLLNVINKEFVGDGTKTTTQLTSHALTNVADDFVITSTTAAGVKTTMTVTIAEGVATVKADATTKATIALNTGIVTFQTAPADKEVWNFQAKEIKFVLNYQLVGNVLFAGLAPAEAPTEIEISETELDADGEVKVFQLAKNLKKGTVSVTFTPAGDGAEEVTATDENTPGQIAVTAGDPATTTVYGTVDYVTGILTMEDAPVSISYNATAYKL